MSASPRLHPAEAILSAHARGLLDPVTSLVVQTHCDLCPICCAEVSALNALGGLMMEDLAPVAMSEGALARALARLNTLPPQPVVNKAAAGLDAAAIPPSLRTLAQHAALTSRWQFAGVGVRSLDLDMDGAEALRAAGGAVQLLRLDPNQGVPHHDHQGREVTLVLSGAFRDEGGYYGPGDFIVVEPGICHRPLGEAGAPCLALIVSAAPPAFTGALGVAQRAWNSL